MFYRAMEKASTYRTKSKHIFGVHMEAERPVNLIEVLKTWFPAYIV